MRGSLPAPAAEHRRRRATVLVCGLTAILVWQGVFFCHGFPQTTLASPYHLDASGGVLHWQQEFVYFLHFLNLYPVASISDGPREYSVEGARRLIAEQGRTLVMDRYWTIRYGDLAKTYLYLPQVWLEGRAEHPRMLHANALAFTLSLLALFAAFWHAGRTLLGAFLVLLIGSNPFQVHEVYANNNLFSWPITVTVLLLALHVPLLLDRQPRVATTLLIVLASGLLLGTFREIRTETILVLASAAGVYLTTTRFRLWLRVGLVLFLGVAFASASAGWRAYFDAKYREAYATVRAAGGHTYDGPLHNHHFLWHALWCGLGDFDGKYGYSWDDVAAFGYAWPVMERRFAYSPDGFPPVRPDVWDRLTLGVYWDRGRQYARTPFETPEYTEVIRQKVLRDIAGDPVWYLSIIGRRALRLVDEGTPPTLALGNGLSVSVPGRPLWGYLAVGLAALLLRRRDWFHLKLLAFTLPLTLTALLVYSGGGTIYYSILHLVALAVAATEACAALRQRRLGFVGLLGERVVCWPERFRARAAEILSKVAAGEPSCPQRHATDGQRRTIVRRTAGIGLVGLLALLSAWTAARALAARETPRAGGSGAPKLVVLPFENETADPGMTWICDAVADLLTADLGGAGVRVLDPDTVERLAADVVWWGRDNAPNRSKAVAVNVAADRSGTQRVVLGRVYRDSRGLLACARLLAPGANPAPTHEVCHCVDPNQPSQASWRLARDLGLTTASEPVPPTPPGPAYRLYVEANRAARKESWGEATRLVNQSLTANPRFSDASLQRARWRTAWQQSDEQTLQALTGRGRSGAALAALRAEVTRDPGSVARRVDLGRMLVSLELFDEATTVLGPLLRLPGAPPEAFGLAAEALSARGDLAQGYQVLLEYQRRTWQEPLGVGLLTDHLTRWRADEMASWTVDCTEGLAFPCAERLRRAREMATLTLDDSVRRWRLRALAGQWGDAEKLAFRMMSIDDPRAAGTGALLLSRGYLVHGRSRLAGALAEEAATRLEREHLDPSEALRVAVGIRMDRDGAAEALNLLRHARSSNGSAQALGQYSFAEALALARLGQWGQAERVRAQLARDLSDLPGPIGHRLLYRLDGELSLLRHDASGALSSLSDAAKLLPARGFCGDHVPVWYALARANLAAGRPRDADVWLQRVTGASYEWLCWPIPYVRSFFLLGQIRAATGQDEEAAEAFERFLDLWGEADLAAAEQDEAQRFLRSHTRSAKAPSNSTSRTALGMGS